MKKGEIGQKEKWRMDKRGEKRRIGKKGEIRGKKDWKKEKEERRLENGERKKN